MREVRERTGHIDFPLSSQRNRVRYLYETVEGIENNPMLLNVLYWTLFDGIEIPTELQKKLIEKAADPQVLGKELRWSIRMARKHKEHISGGIVSANRHQRVCETAESNH